MGAAGGQMVQWLPLSEIATAIQGLLEARGQLIQDFYEISGISDIMRGATDAGETLGAQQLKQHNGSIRVKDKVDELTRIAAETAHIAGEIMAEHFSQKSLMDMSQMQLRTKAEKPQTRNCAPLGNRPSRQCSRCRASKCPRNRRNRCKRSSSKSNRPSLPSMSRRSKPLARKYQSTP
jgi:hypothetical protein